MKKQKLTIFSATLIFWYLLSAVASTKQFRSQGRLDLGTVAVAQNTVPLVQSPAPVKLQPLPILRPLPKPDPGKFKPLPKTNKVKPATQRRQSEPPRAQGVQSLFAAIVSVAKTNTTPDIKPAYKVAKMPGVSKTNGLRLAQVQDQDGNWIYPDGTVVYSDGTTIYPDETTVYPDGTTIYADQTEVYPDGSVTYPNGIAVGTDGTTVHPDGAAVYPDGTTVDYPQ